MKGMRWPLLMMAWLPMASCDRPPSGAHASGEFQLSPLSADELALISGWKVLKISDAPDDLRHFYGFRLFTRTAAGKEQWLGGSGQDPKKPLYDIRTQPVLTAFRQDGSTLQFWHSFVGGMQGKREGFFPAEVSHVECSPQREGDVISLFRVYQPDGITTKLWTSIYIEFFNHPMTEAEIRGTPHLKQKN